VAIMSLSPDAPSFAAISHGTALIVAMTPSGLMGRDNSLPWHWPEDLAHFKRTTRGHAVVMGRRTFDSLRDNFGGPLPNRVNVVVSRERGGPAPDGVLRDGAHWFASLPDALAFAARSQPGETFLLGGADIFRLALDEVAPPPQRLIVTWVPEVPVLPGDTFFPFAPPEPWILQRYREAQRWSDSSGQLQFVVYDRR